MRTVQLQSNGQGIRLRFTISGHRYSLSLSGLSWLNPSHRATAQAIAAQIIADEQAGTFDGTLDRYQNQRMLIQRPIPTSLIGVWDAWVDSLGLSPETRANHYRTTRNAIASGSAFGSDLSAFTHNLRASQLRACLRWSKENGYAVKGVSIPKPKRRGYTPAVEVFTADELRAICSAVSRHRPEYLTFTKFLIISGCRFGEVAAIQGSQINHERCTITINANYRKSHNTGRFGRIASTKTGSVRTLHSEQLIGLVPAELATNDYAFISKTGGPVNRHFFTRRIWPLILDKAEVKYRKLHTIRHTTLSMALEQGLTVPQVADIAGHSSPATLMKTYAHVINRADVPVMDI